MPMDLELFVAACPLCETTAEMVEHIKGPQCTLRVYDLSKEQGTKEAEKYGVRAVPTIVGNGRVMFEGVPPKEELKRCSLEHGCRGQHL